MRNNKIMEEKKLLPKILGLVLISILILFNFSLMTHGIEQFIDKTMLSFVILFAIIYAATFRNKAAFYKNFGDGALRAGWIFAMMSLIVATNSPFFGELHMVEVGMAFATSVLYVLYGFILKTLALLLD